MTYLSDTARVVLAAAAQRADLSVLPFPDDCKAKGGAEQKVLSGLKKRGLIQVLGGDDGGPERVVISREGMAAIGVEPDDEVPAAATEAAATSPDGGSTAAGAGNAADTPASPTEADGAALRAKGAPAKGKAKAAPAAGGEANAQPTSKPTPRAGTKQALMIELLERPEGATVEQIAAATGWQHHTIRGAISGALKKKLGLTVEAIRIREVGPNKTGAKGSATIYRIVG
jgi:hypothetical protein